MNFTVYDIKPVPKPRMTSSSRYKTTEQEAVYYAFGREVRRMHITIPESGYHVIFVLMMPLGWSEKKKNKMRHTAHQSGRGPDKDNLEKALLDSIFYKNPKEKKKNDAHIWNGTVSKVWGDSGKMIIITGIKTDWIKQFLDVELL